MYGTSPLSTYPISDEPLATRYISSDVAIDTVSYTTANLASSVTLAHYVDSVITNRVLIVEVVLQRNAAGTVSTVSGITYNGTAMTRAVRENTYATSISTEIWYLVAPSTGTNNVVVTLNNALTNDIVVGARTLYNVDQTTPLVTTTTNSNFASSISTNVTTSNTGDFIVDALYTYVAPTVGANQKLTYSQYANSNTYGVASSETTTTAGVYTMSWTLASSADISHSVAVFQKAASGGGGTTVTPGTASMSITTFAPTVTLGTVLTPGTASLTLSPQTPTVTVNTILTPDAGTMTLTAFAPTVTVSSGTTLTPGTASMTITTFAPTVAVSDNKFATPGTASLTITTFAPTVSVSNNISLTPGTASLTLTTFAPTATVSDNIQVTPGVAAMVITTYKPTVTVSGTTVTRKYYIDTSGNVYWVINQTLGLVEKV